MIRNAIGIWSLSNVFALELMEIRRVIEDEAIVRPRALDNGEMREIVKPILHDEDGRAYVFYNGKLYFDECMRVEEAAVSST